MIRITSKQLKNFAFDYHRNGISGGDPFFVCRYDFQQDNQVRQCRRSCSRAAAARSLPQTLPRRGYSSLLVQ